MQWSSFSNAETAALARGTSGCPSCRADALRRYLTTPEQARRPTLVTYVWCAACRKFVGTRTAHPDGLIFADPLATQPPWSGSLTGFLEHLDRLWDDGVLPQTFAGQPPWAAANS
ncbi:hypothetical protein AB0M20_05960 [Actinoplanes sp. NPDC051633]|uniref:hypothetical protein n=1 Tax=Actinoplanes sp. NPDC051633 TaxID=3155670 RepID=UPI0034145638